MQNTGLAHLAEALVFVHGPSAASEAARQAHLCEKSGDSQTAAYWRKVQIKLAAKQECQEFERCA